MKSCQVRAAPGPLCLQLYLVLAVRAHVFSLAVVYRIQYAFNVCLWTRDLSPWALSCHTAQLSRIYGAHWAFALSLLFLVHHLVVFVVVLLSSMLAHVHLQMLPTTDTPPPPCDTPSNMTGPDVTANAKHKRVLVANTGLVHDNEVQVDVEDEDTVVVRALWVAQLATAAHAHCRHWQR